MVDILNIIYLLSSYTLFPLNIYQKSIKKVCQTSIGLPTKHVIIAHCIILSDATL